MLLVGEAEVRENDLLMALELEKAQTSPHSLCVPSFLLFPAHTGTCLRLMSINPKPSLLLFREVPPSVCLLWTGISVFLKIHLLKSSPQCDDIYDGGFGDD